MGFQVYAEMVYLSSVPPAWSSDPITVGHLANSGKFCDCHTLRAISHLSDSTNNLVLCFEIWSLGFIVQAGLELKIILLFQSP